MSVLIKIAIGVFAMGVVYGLFVIFYRPVSLKLMGIKAKGITVHDDAVYLEGEKVAGADPGSFEVVGMGYSKDKNHLYFGREVLVGVEPTQFRKINDDPNDFSFRDDTRVVSGGRLVSGADPGSYRVLAAGLAIDKSHIYWGDKPQAQVDTATFTYLGMGYAKDKNNVYQLGSQGGRAGGELKIILGADQKTFEVIPGVRPLPSVPSAEDYEKADAKDAKHNYRNGKALSGR